MQEAAKKDAGTSSPLDGPSRTEEGPTTAVDGTGSAAPPLNSLQQQWAPEPEEDEEEKRKKRTLGSGHQYRWIRSTLGIRMWCMRMKINAS